MGKRETNILLAGILILVGGAGILNQVFHINIFGYISFWDLGILALGLYFEWQFFTTKKSPGLLVPGGILTIVGLFNFLEALTPGMFFADFPSGELGVALGLFQLYWFGSRNAFLLIPVGILLISALDDLSNQFFGWFNGSLVWSIALVVVGVYLLLFRKKEY